MAFDFVGKGVGAEHNSAQDSLAAIYGLHHRFFELRLLLPATEHHACILVPKLADAFQLTRGCTRLTGSGEKNDKGET